MDATDHMIKKSPVKEVTLLEEAEKRYLNYAMSVITSRALPDVRDGLKPVQRRILFAMFHHLKLLPSGKFRKSAAVVGEVMGKYHPHGDQAIYDAMVRMAQSFSLRHPLIDGYGNFGSVDGDKAAAMRYTEVRLQPLSLELLQELPKDTTDMRPNFDGTLDEPVVLPARFPQLLINGCMGIAVGMATNIPPHNFGEVMDALLLLLDEPNAPAAKLMKKIKGPDFPTGGEIITPRKDRSRIYEEGQGNILIRGEWKEDSIRGKKSKKSQNLIITSIPYNVNKSTLIEKIAEVILSKKIPHLLDVRDESTEKIRIVLELKSGTSQELIMGYLYKHTPLQQRFSVNLTCLVPTQNPLVSAPTKLPLKEMLEQFLSFRLHVLEKRFTYDLNKLRRRIHILEGFAILFGGLDEAIRIIRLSDGRKDAGQRLMKRFALDQIQVDAILDTRLYRISRLEIAAIQEELRSLREQASQLEKILTTPNLLRQECRQECLQLRKTYATPRKTRLKETGSTPQFQPEDLIIDEDTHAVLSRAGWIKRIKTIHDLSTIRVREEDSIMCILPGNTKSSVCFFSNFGMVYTTSLWDIPATKGYGIPIQNLFKFQDGEKVIAAFSMDSRISGDIGLNQAILVSTSEKTRPSPTHLLAVTQKGHGIRLSLTAFHEPSTKNGRRFLRRNKQDQVLDVFLVKGHETLILVSQKKRALLFPVEEVKLLAAAGKGVRLIQMDEDDQLFASTVSNSSSFGLELETSEKEIVHISPKTERSLSKRNSRGTTKRIKGEWSKVHSCPLSIPSLQTEGTLLNETKQWPNHTPERRTI